MQAPAGGLLLGLVGLIDRCPTDSDDGPAVGVHHGRGAPEEEEQPGRTHQAVGRRRAQRQETKRPHRGSGGCPAEITTRVEKPGRGDQQGGSTGKAMGLLFIGREPASEGRCLSRADRAQRDTGSADRSRSRSRAASIDRRDDRKPGLRCPRARHRYCDFAAWRGGHNRAGPGVAGLGDRAPRCRSPNDAALLGA